MRFVGELLELHSAGVLESGVVAVLEAAAVCGYGRALDGRVDVQVGDLRIDGTMGELIELRGFDAVAKALLGLFGSRGRSVPFLSRGGVLVLGCCLGVER